MLFISLAILFSCYYAMDIYIYMYPSHICVPDITKFIVKSGRMLLPKFLPFRDISEYVEINAN